MKTAIVVFAKTLGLTPVKTRLAAHIGQKQANTFYELSVKALRSTLNTVKMQNAQVDIYWALAESDGTEHPDWQGSQTLWTGEGSLGERLNRVTKQLFESYEAVLMIGTDSPQLQVKHFTEAIALLKPQEGHTVAGPCTDGGFYLFGSTEALGDKIWHSISYSQSDTLDQLLGKIKNEDLTFSLMEPLCDVDVVEDLEPLRTALSTLVTPNVGQLELIEWLKQVD